jgi:hypothetical protein
MYLQRTLSTKEKTRGTTSGLGPSLVGSASGTAAVPSLVQHSTRRGESNLPLALCRRSWEPEERRLPSAVSSPSAPRWKKPAPEGFLPFSLFEVRERCLKQEVRSTRHRRHIHPIVAWYTHVYAEILESVFIHVKLEGSSDRQSPHVEGCIRRNKLQLSRKLGHLDHVGNAQFRKDLRNKFHRQGFDHGGRTLVHRGKWTRACGTQQLSATHQLFEDHCTSPSYSKGW